MKKLTLVEQQNFYNWLITKEIEKTNRKTGIEIPEYTQDDVEKFLTEFYG